MIAAGLQDKSIRLFDVRNCQEMQSLQDEFLCTSLAFSPRGDIIASGSVGRIIKLWDIRTGDHLATLEGHSYPVLSLSFSPDGDKLVSGSGDTTLKIWDVESLEELGTMKGHTLYVVSCDWDPMDNRIVSGSVDSTIREWDPNTQETLAVHDDHRTAVHVVRFTKDGSKLASGSSDMTIGIWEAGRPMRLQDVLRGHQTEVRCVAFSHDGKYLASGSSDKTIYVWNPETHTVKGESRTVGEVDGIEWIPDSHSFVSSDGSGAVIRWEVTDLEAMLAPFQQLLAEIQADSELVKRDEFVERFESIVSRYDAETLKDKRLFYVQWQCKKALGLLKGKVIRKK
jgi:WD40 repeat protein